MSVRHGGEAHRLAVHEGRRKWFDLASASPPATEPCAFSCSLPWDTHEAIPPVASPLGGVGVGVGAFHNPLDSFLVDRLRSTQRVAYAFVTQ